MNATVPPAMVSMSSGWATTTMALVILKLRELKYVQLVKVVNELDDDEVMTVGFVVVDDEGDLVEVLVVKYKLKAIVILTSIDARMKTISLDCFK